MFISTLTGFIFTLVSLYGTPTIPHNLGNQELSFTSSGVYANNVKTDFNSFKSLDTCILDIRGDNQVLASVTFVTRTDSSNINYKEITISSNNVNNLQFNFCISEYYNSSWEDDYWIYYNCLTGDTTFNGVQDKNVFNLYDYQDYDYKVSFTCNWFNETIYNGVVNSSYDEGRATGYAEGYEEGRATGFAEGEQSGTGYQNGYRDGYNNGLSQSTHDFGFMNLFTGIADTPILMMRSLFDFSIFGTSVLAVVLSLFTSLVVIHLLKRLIK